MPTNDTILGPTVGINAPSAADLLAARIEAINSANGPGPSPFYVGPEGASQDLRVAGMTSDDALDAILAENTAAAAGPQAAYEEVRRIDVQAMKQARGEYAELGLHDLAASNSPIFRDYAARAQQQARYDAGYADTPDLPIAPEPIVPIGNGPTLYNSAKHLDTVTTAELNEEYTGTGRFDLIDKPAYAKELKKRKQQARYEAGFVNEEEVEHGPLANMREDWNDESGYGKLNYGYALQQVGQEGSQYYEKTQSGQYLTPEQQETASAGFLPGLGAVAGTLIGSAIAPGVGSWVGGMIGAGVGQAAEGVIGANETREQSTRESAERINAALGGTADALISLKSQIEETGVSTVQFGQALQTVGSVGTFGAGTVSGVAALTNSFQERAGEDFGVIAKYTSSPLLYGLGNRFSSGLAGSGDIVSLGFDAAEQGDFSGLKTLQQSARDASTKDDKAYQDAAGTKATVDSSWWTKAGNWVGGVLTGHNLGDEAQATMDSRRAADIGTVDATAAAQNALINQFASLKSRDIVAESGVKYAESGIGLVTAEGGSVGQIGAASQSLYSSLDAARSATQSEVGQLQADLADPVRSAGRADELKARIADAQAKLGGFDVAEAQQRRSVFQTGLGEEDANFNLYAARDTLRGDSAASMLGGYDRQAAHLTTIAEDPRSPLSPTERAGIEQSADQMRYAAGRSVYQEAIGWAGVREVQGQGQIGIAQTYGSPMDVYHADISQIGNEQSEIAVIDNRLRQNIPMSERIPLMNQRQGIENDITIAPERARVDAYNAEGSILGNNQAAGRAQLDRDAEVYGAKAFTPAILAADQDNLNLYTGAENGSPIGSQQRAQFGRERADAEAQLQRDRDSSYRFGDQATRVRDMEAEGRFERNLKNPYQDGNPDADPRTAGRALEGVYQQDLTRAEAALRATPKDSPSYERNADAVEDYKNKISDIELRQRTAYESLIPEMLAGSPGQGRLTGILPTPGQSAFYNANPFVNGSFGKPGTQWTADGEGHTPQAGGEAGAYLAATSGGTSAGAVTSSDARALAAAIHRFVDFASRSTQGGTRSPVMTSGSTGGVSPYEYGGGAR